MFWFQFHGLDVIAVVEHAADVLLMFQLPEVISSGHLFTFSVRVHQLFLLHVFLMFVADVVW